MSNKNKRKMIFFMIFLFILMVAVIIIQNFVSENPIINTQARADLDSKTWLLFWGSFLSFIGAIFLGIVAIYQNFSLEETNKMMILGSSAHLDIRDDLIITDDKIEIHLINRKNIPILTVENCSAKINDKNVFVNTCYFAELGLNTGSNIYLEKPKELMGGVKLNLSYVFESDNFIKILVDMELNTIVNNDRLEIQNKKMKKTVINL